MIGSKLPFVMADWDGLVSAQAWLENGKTILFGLVGGYFGVEMAKAILGVTIKTGDSFAVPVAAAVSVGRLACFVGGCCFGKPTGLPWGVVFHDGIPRHPTHSTRLRSTHLPRCSWPGPSTADCSDSSGSSSI